MDHDRTWCSFFPFSDPHKYLIFCSFLITEPLYRLWPAERPIWTVCRVPLCRATMLKIWMQSLFPSWKTSLCNQKYTLILQKPRAGQNWTSKVFNTMSTLDTYQFTLGCSSTQQFSVCIKLSKKHEVFVDFAVFDKSLFGSEGSDVSGWLLSSRFGSQRRTHSNLVSIFFASL